MFPRWIEQRVGKSWQVKITDAKVVVGGPGKSYVTLTIMTDQGVYGLGDATLNNRETLPCILTF